MRVLITGGAGGLGRALLASAGAARHELRALSRRPRPPGVATAVDWVRADLVRGDGLPQALAGVQAIVHAATDSKRPGETDVRGTRQLVDAARAAGVGHLVYVSIVGIDDIPLPYYEVKLAVERMIAGSGVPYSILRATQFHSLVEHFIKRAARAPLVIPLPTALLFQSVATSEVADRLLAVAAQTPGGRLRDMGGPETMTLGAAARVWRAVRGVRKPIAPLPALGRVAAAFRAGKNTTAEGDRGRVTWEEWLRGEV